MRPHDPVRYPTQSSIIAEGLAAGLVAGLVEFTVFWWNRDYALSLPYVARHVALLAAGGGAMGLIASRGRWPNFVARTWLVLPSLVAVSPLLTRRIGWLSIIAVGSIVLWWITRTTSSRRESPITGALVGTLVGTATVSFLAEDYVGRSTAMGPLLLMAAQYAAAAIAYGACARIWHWESSRPLPLVAVSAGVMLLTLIVMRATGDAIPSRVVPLDTNASRGSVVLIVLDTVRADHLPTYGYPRDTMPRLAEFAHRGVAVRRAITNAPDSLAAHASLFTGLPPPVHGAHRPLPSDPDPPAFGYPLRSDVPTIAEVLRAHGYATVGVSGNPGPLAANTGLGLDRGFDVYRSDPPGDCAFRQRTVWHPLVGLDARLWIGGWLTPCRGRMSRVAEEITADAVELVNAASGAPFFLFVNYMDAHRGYVPPPPFDEMFEGVASDLVFGDIPNAQRASVLSGQSDLPDRSRRHLEALYDGELRYLDTHLDRLLGYLEHHPAWEDMLVVITSDHGEAFGEHRLLGHTTSLYDVMIRVPLIFKFGRTRPPGSPEDGGSWNTSMQLSDIFPITMQHAGIDGVGQTARVGDSFPRAWSYPPRTVSEFWDRFDRSLRSIEDGRWKLIEDSRGSVELYDLRDDPRELRNLAGANPEIVAALRARLGSDPPYRQVHRDRSDPESAETIERLRSLGYVR